MIYHKPKIGFVHVPRTSGTSVEHALMKKYPQATKMFVEMLNIDKAAIRIKAVTTRHLDGGVLEFQKKHATYKELIDYCPDYKYYATVRHPKTKLESLYRLISYGMTDDVPWYEGDFNTWVEYFLSDGLCMEPQAIVDVENYELTQSEFIGDAEWHTMESGSIWNALDIDKPLHRYKLSDAFSPIEWNDRSHEMLREYYAEDFHRFKYDINT